MSIERNRRKRERNKAKRHERLETAHLDGWKKCSDFHYQKSVAGIRIDWWPSTNKCMIKNQIYRIFDESDMLPIIESLTQKKD